MRDDTTLLLDQESLRINWIIIVQNVNWMRVRACVFADTASKSDLPKILRNNNSQTVNLQNE